MFTPYYILAVSFGAFATIVSLWGIKNKNNADYPGRFAGLLMLIGVVFGIATFGFVWKGGEEELDHKKHEQQHQLEESQKAAEDGAAGDTPRGTKKN